MILTSSFRAYASREEQNQKNLSQSALEFHTGPSYALPLSFFTVLKKTYIPGKNAQNHERSHSQTYTQKPGFYCQEFKNELDAS